MHTRFPRTKGRLTIGDAGRINYAEYVGRATLWVHWQGEPPGSGTPAHPTRKIYQQPAVFEFAAPVAGSYPPWYDPSYWYEGIRPRFSLRGQAAAIGRCASAYLRFVSKSGALWVWLAAFLFLWKNTFRWSRLAPRTWWALLPSFAALAMYGLVHVEVRYVAPWALVLLLGVMANLRFADSVDSAKSKRLQLLIAAAPVLAIAWAAAGDVRTLVRNAPDEQWAVAQELHELGITPKGNVAAFGLERSAAWAHLAKVRIIAEIPDKELPEFVGATAERKREIYALLKSYGVESVVTGNAAVASSGEGWQAIPGTHYFVRTEQQEAGQLRDGATR